MKAKQTIAPLLLFAGLFTAGSTLVTAEHVEPTVHSIGLAATPTPDIEDVRDLTKYGIVKIDAPPIADVAERERRAKISKRYDGQGWVYPTVTNPKTGGVGKIKDDPVPPLFPVQESTIIAIGEVVAASAFLSNDKGGVYTEVSIRVDELLKNGTGISDVKTLIADREGGVVIYPNGARLMYQNSDIGLPWLGSKYVFFLTKDQSSPNFGILISYALDHDKIYQMEMGRSFKEFENLSPTAFLKVVRGKVFDSRPTEPTPSCSPSPPDDKVMDVSRLPITDFESPLVGSPMLTEERQKKNARYDNDNFVMKTPHPEDSGVGRYDHEKDVAAVPVDQSDMIVVGRVLEANAYLSNDKRGIYSEFTMVVETVLKPYRSVPIQPGERLSFDRAGGRVRYSNGQMLAYQNIGAGFPKVGESGLFFLTNDARNPNYQLLHGYEFSGEIVNSLAGHILAGPLACRKKSDLIRVVQEKAALSSPLPK